MENKVIVITGASHGLGAEMARILRTKKAQVVISARNKDELEKLAKEINAVPIVADVTQESDVEQLAEDVISKFGRIDIWINNAGVWLPRLTLEETDMKRAHDILEVNLFGTVYGSKSAVIQMKKQGSGMIVNIISTSALQGRPLSAMYSASKHAAKGFTDSMREELKDANIKVIGIYPGGIKTHLFDEQKPDDYDDYMEPAFVAEKIIANLEKETPENDLILKRPGQKIKL